MNNLLFQVYSDQNAEFLALQALGVDITDWPLTPTLISQLSKDSRFLVTSPVSAFDMFDVEFNLANTYWGVPFNFGNNPAGVQIRQGIAHLVDKDAFIANRLGGLGNKIDNPEAPSQGVPSPNVCAWDQMFPTCLSAYHIASYGTTDGMAPVGSLDFCAAADHFISAGLATGKDPTTCVLTGLSSAAASQSIQLFARVDDAPRLALGTALASEIGKLMGRSSAVAVSQITIQQASNAIFQAGGGSPNLGWNIYTGGFRLTSAFDQPYSLYNSLFASTFCGSLIKSSFPANYVYACNSAMDSWTNMLEFNTTLSGATASAVQAEDVYGRHAFGIPIWSGADQFGYLNGWTGVNNAVGTGPPNIFTWLNAWRSNAAVPWTIREGLKQGTFTLNMYNALTVWEFYILSEVYDSLLIQNPANPNQLMGLMAQSWRVINPSLLGYTPPAGTVETIRFQLRNDIFWHDGVQVTSKDVKFSIISYRDAPAANLQSSVQTVIDATIIGTFVVDVHLGLLSPFAELNIGTLPIIPQHIWAAGGTGFVADSTKTSKSFDPVASNALIGSGPYICANGPLGASTTTIGGGCTSSGTGAVGPGGAINLQRYGLNQAHSLGTQYFRSSFNVKQWSWADGDGSGIVDIFDIAAVATCFGKTVTGGLNPQCAHWDTGVNGIGGNNNGVVDIQEFAIVARWFGVQWISPFKWADLTGVQPFPPTVYEGSTVYP
jgi:ABC-type transport system substrate-binding protein